MKVYSSPLFAIENIPKSSKGEKSLINDDKPIH